MKKFKQVSQQLDEIKQITIDDIKIFEPDAKSIYIDLYNNEDGWYSMTLEELLVKNKKSILIEIENNIIGKDEKRFFRENINALKHEIRNELRSEFRKKISLLNL